MAIETIVFKNDTLLIVDQTKLPNVLDYIQLENIQQAVDAIKMLKVRGAPAIGITAAYALYVETLNLSKADKLNYENFFNAYKQICSARPTAVNLEWAATKMLNCFSEYRESQQNRLLTKLKQLAINIHNDDRTRCERIGQFGSTLLDNKFNILTHCNAGSLATGGIGTALAPIYTCFREKQNFHVYVDETRPLGQGARLTYFELQNAGIECTLICDNMAGHLFSLNKIDCVIVGADRIVANGDIANKIGTYTLACLAFMHKIPFYVAAPISTFDFDIKDGNEIPIENRDKNEISSIWNFALPDKSDPFNPAFDVTPSKLISAIITDVGIINSPIAENINKININEGEIDYD